jgi:hypothetical protein
MFAANSGTEVGVVGDGEFDGNDNAPAVVKAVQVGAKRAAGVIVVVGRRGRGIGAIIRAATRVVVGRGERRQRSLSDPGSSRQ